VCRCRPRLEYDATGWILKGAGAADDGRRRYWVYLGHYFVEYTETKKDPRRGSERGVRGSSNKERQCERGRISNYKIRAMGIYSFDLFFAFRRGNNRSR
jgi:hypothetical protein